MTLAVLMLAGVHQLGASSRDKYTVMSTSEPIVAGGKVLQPGVYVWRLLDSASDRHIVQISDKETGHVETTILATPNYRAQASDKSSFQFWESAKGLPKPIRSWFYPGETLGEEFAYPEAVMALLAKTQPLLTPVPASPLPAALQPIIRAAGSRRLAGKPSITAAPRNAAAGQASWAAASGESKPMKKSAVTERTHNTIWDRLKTLPLTATFAPLAGLIGLGCLILALVSYLKRRNQQAAL